MYLCLSDSYYTKYIKKVNPDSHYTKYFAALKKQFVCNEDVT